MTKLQREAAEILERAAERMAQGYHIYVWAAISGTGRHDVNDPSICPVCRAYTATYEIAEESGEAGILGLLMAAAALRAGDL